MAETYVVRLLTLWFAVGAFLGATDGAGGLFGIMAALAVLLLYTLPVVIVVEFALWVAGGDDDQSPRQS